MRYIYCSLFRCLWAAILPFWLSLCLLDITFGFWFLICSFWLSIYLFGHHFALWLWICPFWFSFYLLGYNTPDFGFESAPFGFRSTFLAKNTPHFWLWIRPFWLMLYILGHHSTLLALILPFLASFCCFWPSLLLACPFAYNTLPCQFRCSLLGFLSLLL